MFNASRLSEAARVPFVKRVSGCHAFPYLAGSITYKETGSLKLAQEQLVRANIAITGDIYVHPDGEEVDRTAEILGKTLGGICGKSVVNPVLETGTVQ